ncbi:hypothetical protein KDK77_00005 [bacterium]|nr:hypothetical protein [bacterium]MCP5461616.1 hypothetical protein [bacterium]
MVASPLQYSTEQYRDLLDKNGYSLVYVGRDGFNSGVVCIIFDAKNIDWNDYNERKNKRKILVVNEHEFIRNHKEIIETIA